jgi:FemAB-related protein (PEP-CTERM system-associated)
MDIRVILDDIDAAIIKQWGSLESCPCRTALASLADQLHSIGAAIKAKKNDKQLCAKAFAPAKAQGADVGALKQQMQQISDALTALEQQLLDLFSATNDHTNNATPLDAMLPARFANAAPEITVPGPIIIAAASVADAASWDRYVEAHPRAALYHRYVWREVVTEAFAHESFYWLARDSDGAVRGVLPIVRLRSRLFGDFGVALPFFNYGGVLADNQAIAEQLLQHAAQAAQSCGMRHLEIRSTIAMNTWPMRTDKVSMILKLPSSSTELDAQLGSKIRAQINRARQEQPQVLIGHLDLLDDFYEVFARNMRDLGTPVYAKRFFKIILQSRPTQSHIIVLRSAGRAVAAAFLLGDRDLMEIPWASTLRSANTASMNMLLYWEVLSFCIERGYPFFDFGRSTRDAGTFRFKKQWGAEPLQHYWQYWLADGGELPALKPDSPKFRLLIACWRKLPLFVTKLIGPPIVQYLP